MKLHLTSQQLSFYSSHGYIAFEDLPLDLAAMKKEILRALKKKEIGRDLWREEISLQNTLTRKLGPLALQLTQKKSLHLAMDQWISASEEWSTSSPLQNYLSFQGLACVVCILFDEKSPAFFMHPSCWPGLIPHWPQEKTDCYLIGYGNEQTIYIMNPKDAHNHHYKKYGFGFGDSIKKNPLIT